MMAREAERSDRVEQIVLPSVLDRLDEERQPRTGGRPPTWADSVAQLRRAVLDDLQQLLNTRRIAPPPGAGRPEVARSLYVYGLPDLGSVSRDAAEEQRTLARRVEETITLFEPRLSGVRVTIVEVPDAERRELRFLVEALLRVEPVPEPVVFDARVEMATGEVALEGDAHG
jgi:type VI secretion system protein ImpF